MECVAGERRPRGKLVDEVVAVGGRIGDRAEHSIAHHCFGNRIGLRRHGGDRTGVP